MNIIGAFLAVPTLAVMVAVVTAWQETGSARSAEERQTEQP